MKTYACPFCNKKLKRNELVKHIEKYHDEELPLDYTAYRMVYDIVNDKHGHGNCTICGKPTKWNEKRQKYERLCGDPKCAKKVKEIYQKRMLRVYNKTSLMDDPMHQEKMLAARKISGKYKWSDGKIFTYTGSYEKKFLEFLDHIMEFKSSEVIAPGPILEYEYKGKKHHWITDFLILPYNLIIEVKDGGDNPNRRPMKSYREKQVYKEKMITNLGTYSYLRLPNNDFGKFLSTIAELKMKVKDDDNTPLYNIYEAASSPKYENIDMFYEASDMSDLCYLAERCSIERLQEINSSMINIERYRSIVYDDMINEDVMGIYKIYPVSRSMDEEDFCYICGKIFNEINNIPDKPSFEWVSFYEDMEYPKKGMIIGIVRR